MISEIMLSNGYATFGFTSNPCTSSLRGYDKGFTIFKDDNVVKDINTRKLALKVALRILFTNPYSSASQINSQVLLNLNRTESPFFVWIHYMDIHGPYISKNGWQLKNRISATKLWKKALNMPNKVTDEEKTLLKNIYKEKVRFLDYYMIDLIKKIDDENTIIIITADHGDVFGERGYFGHPFIFYNEMINVPLFIKLPSEFGISNTLCRQPVSLVDLVPTILDLLRIKIENDFDGNSLLPLIQDRENEYKTKYIISEISRKYACAIRGHWKLIANYGESTIELYNLKEDCEETKNLASERLEISKELNGAIKDHIKRNKITSDMRSFSKNLWKRKI